MNKITKIIRILKKKYSADEFAEHNGRNPYRVLISCILSLRTKDETTYPAAKRLFKLAKTPKQMLKLNTKRIEKTIFPVGFYKTKAKRIKGISKKLIEEYKGKVPDKIEELLKFKGVGRKTANIVMVYGHSEPYYLPIDTHCHRIPNRLGWIETKTPEESEKELKKILPKKYWWDFNHIFVRFGQNICKPVKPHCWECPISEYCKYYKEIYSLSMGK